MWILELQVGSRVIKFHLVFGGDYTVGRKDADILLEDADVSISRQHAKITVLPVPAGNLSDFTFVPEAYLSDSSKHGSSVNEIPLLATEKSRRLQSGDRVKFGRHVTGTITYSPIVVSMSPRLETKEKKAIVDATGKIGGILTSPLEHAVLYEARVSPFMFVYCTNEVCGEPEALRAMMCGYVLVNSEYVPNLFTIMRDSWKLPLTNLPQPGTFDAMRSPLLADRPYHRPEPTIYLQNEFLFSTPREPDSTFRMLHFVFLEEDQFDKYEHVVTLGGGHATLIAPEAVMDWEIQDEDLPLMGLVEATKSHGHNAYFVLSSDMFSQVMEVTSMPTVRSAADLHDTVRAYLRLWDAGFRLMHEENFHVAVYTSDTASQIADNAPGMLIRSEMDFTRVREDDADSDATDDGFADSTPLPPENPASLPVFRAGAPPSDSDDESGSSPVISGSPTIRQAPSRRSIQIHEPRQLVPSPSIERNSPSPGSTSRSPDNRPPRNIYEEYRAAQSDRREPSLRAARDLNESVAVEEMTVTRRPQQQSYVSPSAPLAQVSLTRRPVYATARSSVMDGAAENRAVVLCRDFTQKTLRTVATRVEIDCTAALKQRFISPMAQQYLGSTRLRVVKFLANLDTAEMSVGENKLSLIAKHQIAETRDRAETLVGAIDATFRELGIHSHAEELPVAEAKA